MLQVDPSMMTFSLAVAMGLIFGLGPCNLSCLPYLGPVFFAREGGVRNSWRTIVPFSLGRMSGYSALGLLSGMLGQVMGDSLDASWVRMFLGSATIMVGIGLLFLTAKKQHKQCHATSTSGFFKRFGDKLRLQNLLPGGLFFMGLGMALNPCAPLGAIMLASSATASAMLGLTLGFGFGFGAILMPAIIFGVGIAYFGEQIRSQLRDWRAGLEKTSAVLLILMGGSTFFI
ncbi:MAG: sulfite exporter TauE/SafE family protein [Gammaproteobacteria bacterium]|nr:sulfite exporter TauE/SafE family protein [Gammaproteobacteria bacterium]